MKLSSYIRWERYTMPKMFHNGTLILAISIHRTEFRLIDLHNVKNTLLVATDVYFKVMIIWINWVQRRTEAFFKNEVICRSNKIFFVLFYSYIAYLKKYICLFWIDSGGVVKLVLNKEACFKSVDGSNSLVYIQNVNFIEFRTDGTIDYFLNQIVHSLKQI